MYNILAKFYDGFVGIDYGIYEDIIKDIIKKDDYCLDMACGSGTVISILNKYSSNVIGSDISVDMLVEAKEKNPYNEFFSHDLREDFYLKGLDLITCTVDSVNYILEKEGLENFFRNVSENLKIGGYFLFDVYSESKLKTLEDYSYHEVHDDYSFIWDSYVDDDIITHMITFYIEEDGKITRYDEEHHERVYQKNYIESFLSDYEIKLSYSEDRLIYLCKKIK